MIEITNVYKESFPSLRLIGIKYTEKDRVNGSFGMKWGEWFQNGYFNILESIPSLPENENAQVGFMKCDEEFQYWIGMLFPIDTEVPENFSYIDIPAADIATCWILGYDETGEIFGVDAHNMCIEKIKENNFKIQENGYYFERYNEERFTTKNDDGKIILDYCVYLKN